MRHAHALWIVAVAITGVLLNLTPAIAQKRVALVIGNEAYQKVAKLRNPVKDAHAIAGMLQSAGFGAVKLHVNLGIREMRQAINDFADVLRDSDMAVVYYSGHGIEVNGVNYLVPIDAVLDRDSDVTYETVSLDNLVQVMEPARELRLVMLDACRDNPFVRTMKRTVALRGVGRGLAPVEPVSVNTWIAYAAKAGSYALDGDDDENSPYAIALLNHLPTPKLDLRMAFGRVRDQVLKITKNKQEPFVYGSLGGETISIAGGSEGTTLNSVMKSGPLLDRAGQVWLATKDTMSAAVLEEFIRQFGNTPYGSMARARLDEVKKSKLAVAAPAEVQNQPAASQPQTPLSNGAAICGGMIAGSWDVTTEVVFPATMVMPGRGFPKWKFKSDGPLGGVAFLNKSGSDRRRYSCQGNSYALDNFFGITLTLSPDGRRLDGACHDAWSALGGGCRIHAVRKSGPPPPATEH